MKLLTRTLLVLLLITPLFAHADEAGKKAKIEELMQLTDMNHLMSQMVGQMTARMKASAAQQESTMHLTPEQETAYNEYQQKLNELLTSSVSWDKLEPLMVQVYSETYTDQELDGILNFYRSPAGHAMVAKTPQLMTKTADLMRQQIAALQPQVQHLSRDFAAKMQKATPAPAPAK